jgi:hypothetical protein
MVSELRAELRGEFANLKGRVDVLERPRIARVISDPARFQDVGGGNSASETNAFQALGVGTLAYLRILDCVDVKALCGAEIAPHEYAVALIDADGSPHLIRGTIAQCVIEARERGLQVAAVH